MNIKFMEWNLNFGAKENVKVPNFVETHLVQENADVIVLTECKGTCGLEQMLENHSYQVFVSSELNGLHNQVIIAIKEAIPTEKISLPQEVRMKEMPDILHVCMEIDNKRYHVLGTRIKIGLSDMEKDYQFRQEQFKRLVQYADTLENVIILGDFNNGMIRADSNLPYRDAKESYQYTNDTDEKGERKESLLRFYNFHLMKDILGEKYTLDEVGGENSSWGLNMQEEYLSFGRIKNDQVITTKQIEVIEAHYDWSFVRQNADEYWDMLMKKKKKGNKITHGYPDHAKLVVNVNLI